MRKLLVLSVLLLCLVPAHKSIAIPVIASFNPLTGTGACNIVIPGTSTGVGATCLPSADLPSLTTPQDPAANPYNADTTGVNDATQAVASAMANGDVYFQTAGTYLINNCTDCTSNGVPHSWCTGGAGICSISIVNSIHGMAPPANRKIACKPGVNIVLKDSLPSWSHDYGMFYLANGGNTVSGCTFKGTNSNAPTPLLSGNTGVGQVTIVSNNDIVQGNTFGNVLGDGAVPTRTEGGTASNYIIRYNTFQNTPLYGVVNAGQSSGGTITNNYCIDCLIGIEWDDCDTTDGGSGTMGTSTFTNNYVKTVSGSCAQNGSSTASCANPGLEAEVYSNNATCNGSGVTMGTGNYAAGTASIGAHIYGGLGGGNAGQPTSNQAVITGNTCNGSAFCSCTGIGAGQSCP